MLNFPSFFNAQAGAYEIEQSLRFNSADSPYLVKTFSSSPTSSTTQTFSWWAKLLNTDSANQFPGIYGRNASIECGFSYRNTGDANTPSGFKVENGSTKITTSAAYRDFSAWFHCVMVFDTNNATSTDRMRLYVNGERITSFSLSSFPASGATVGLLSTYTNGNYIGSYIGGGNYGDFYLAEFHGIDGQALTADSFGEFDNNGVWRPKRYTGSHGSNGFYLKFDPSATNGIGHDHSGNGNNFTATGFDTTNSTASTYDVMSDTPTTNYCTLNPLFNNGTEGPGTLSEGNLRHLSDNNYATCPGTMSLRNGKYYWEAQPISIGASMVGIIRGTNPAENTWIGYDTNNNVFGFSYQNNGYVYGATGTGTSTGAAISTSQNTYTTTDVIGVAVDIPSGTLDWYKNGTLEYSITGINDDDWFPAVSSYSTDTWEVNFGQRAFAYTPPTGFKALNTSNLPAPTVKDGSDYFNTVLYTGNDGTQTVPGVGFQPDLVWVKNRSTTASHWLNDAVRGAGLSLASDTPEGEKSYAAYFTAFNSDGFALAGGTPGFNDLNNTYVAWNWLAGGSGSSIAAGSIDGTNPTIASTVSANPSAGFSIVSYQSQTATKPITLGHGLGVKPSMIICKNRDAASSWTAYHSALGATKAVFLNSTLAAVTSADYWNNTEPTSTVFTVNDSSGTHAYGTSNDMIAYCFAEVEGYSKFGSYTGNGSTTGDGPFVYLGFKPALVIWKRTSGSVYHWVMRDSTRDIDNPTQQTLYPSLSTLEQTLTAQDVDFLSNGFKIKTNWDYINQSGEPYIFMAWASSPFGGSNVSPATAR